MRENVFSATQLSSPCDLHLVCVVVLSADGMLSLLARQVGLFNVDEDRALVMLPAASMAMVTRVAVDPFPAHCLLDQATENTYTTKVYPRHQRSFRHYYRDHITFTEHSTSELPSRVTHAEDITLVFFIH